MPDLFRATHHRYADANGESHFDTAVTVERRLASGSPPATPFSEERPASKYRFYTFAPGRISELHAVSGTVEMETTDKTVRRLEPGDPVLLEDVSRKAHITRNVGEGYTTFLAIPIPSIR